MRKRILVCLLCALLVLNLPVFVQAEETSGTCGNGITWTYDNGTLTVSGSGAMDNMGGGAPWDAFKADIHTVIFTGGVTYVGAYAFKDYDSLRSVSFGTAMYELGTEGFYSCDGLTALPMPDSFTASTAPAVSPASAATVCGRPPLPSTIRQLAPGRPAPSVSWRPLSTAG